ncbi:hypothetical protein CLOP_g11386 [Closterium sp. NIES-67]|nr:hypothetical protein CLOP_g11386 [Closterium sp. NIES-67]
MCCCDGVCAVDWRHWHWSGDAGGRRSAKQDGRSKHKRPWCARGSGAPEAVVHQRRWCTRGGGAPEAVVQQRRWCSRGGGAAEAVVHQRRWCTRGGGAPEAVVHQRRGCSRGGGAAEAGGVWEDGPGGRRLTKPQVQQREGGRRGTNPQVRRLAAAGGEPGETGAACSRGVQRRSYSWDSSDFCFRCELQRGARVSVRGSSPNGQEGSTGKERTHTSAWRGGVVVGVVFADASC